MTAKNHFGAHVARVYDAQDTGDPSELQAMVALLAELAGPGRALEFAIGTGRVALPLAAAGVEVAGIELSQPMVDQLRAKPGGAEIEVAVGDMATERVAGAFSLVFLVYNTIDNLTTQDAQVACFENAAAHLAPGGRFVVETQVPPVQRMAFGEAHRSFALEDGHWGIEEVDIATQAHASHHVWFDGQTTQRRSVPFRYAWPAEMDLMARIAGMRLQHRWSDWRGAPFDRFSTRHVSVWERPAPEGG